MTSEPSTLFALPESMSSPAASRAAESLPPASELALRIRRLLCGAISPESLATLDPGTSSSRTWRTSSLCIGERSGEPFSGTWPRSGMTRGGIAFPLRPSAPRTSVTASSWSLRTPNQADASGGMQDGAIRRAGGHQVNLDDQLLEMLPTIRHTDALTGPNGGRQRADFSPRMDHALIDLLPTPTAKDAANARNKTSSRQPDSQHHSGTTLPDVEHEWQLLPTPMQADAERRSATYGNGSQTLDGSLGASTPPQSTAGKKPLGLRRNPSFREWLMGAPEGWTDPASQLSATEFSSKPPATSASS
jgi:hypothetical protein